jgi:Flp pilus assembly pilin Flp
MKNLLKRFALEESGLETIEYAIITGLITAGILAAIVTLSAWLSARYASVNAALGPP